MRLAVIEAPKSGVAEQDDDDRVWRLALHRMDLRQYTVATDSPEATTSAQGQTTAHGPRQPVRLELKPPES